jgi:hypothetical protein
MPTTGCAAASAAPGDTVRQHPASGQAWTPCHHHVARPSSCAAVGHGQHGHVKLPLTSSICRPPLSGPHNTARQHQPPVCPAPSCTQLLVVGPTHHGPLSTAGSPCSSTHLRPWHQSAAWPPPLDTPLLPPLLFQRHSQPWSPGGRWCTPPHPANATRVFLCVTQWPQTNPALVHTCAGTPCCVAQTDALLQQLVQAPRC